MISFKYGVILGAILLICIYFAYQNSKIKEGMEAMPIGSGPYIQPCPPGKKEYWGIGNITRGKNKYVGQPIKKGPITEEECRAGCSADSNCSMWLKYPQTGNCWYIPKTITIPDIRCEDEGGQAAPAGARPLMYGQMKCQWASGIGNIKHFNFKKSADGRKFTDLHLSPPTEPCPTGNVYCEANSSVPGSSAWSSQCPSDTQHMIDNPSSIQCGSNWDDSECLSKCCVPNKTCSTYEKCKQLGYELDPDKTATPCNNSICDDPQCCSKDTCVIANSAGIFTCESQHHLDPAKQDYVCGNNCDSDTCCKLNNTCGVDPPTCPQNQYYSNDNSAVVCANAECLSSDCCLDNPTCKSYSDCNTAKQHVGNPSQSCAGGTCDKSCCVNNKKCGGFKKCNQKRHVDPNKRDTACNNNVCTDKQCCSDNPKCGDDTDYSCPSSQYVSLAKKALTCIGERCTAGECCIPEPTCSTYQCSHPDTEHMPDNTIPCPNGICDDKTCCIPNIKCSTFKNCNPGRHIKKEDISCYNNICSDEQCCITNAKCGQFDESGFTCEDNEYIKLPNHTCKEEKCTPQECCVADPTCGSYTCSVGHLQHIKDPSILCPDGNCTDELCCVDNDKCNSFTCPVGKHGIAEDERCTDNICTEDQCCVNNQRCATSWCDENYTLTNISTICKHKECTAKECCEPNPTCSSFSCEAGYTMRSSPAEIICDHLLCTGGDCCLKNQKCSTYNCRAGQTKKEDNKVCEGIKCTNEECCTNNPTCSTYKCESSYYTTRTLVPHAEGIICGELKCKESECCNSTPTNKLPKINVWPLS
jgi:hypothetical protein